MLTTLYCYILRYHLCEESHLLNTQFTRHNPYGISYISLFPVSQQHTGEIDSLYLIQPLTPTPLDAHLPWSQLHYGSFLHFYLSAWILYECSALDGSLWKDCVPAETGFGCSWFKLPRMQRRQTTPDIPIASSVCLYSAQTALKQMHAIMVHMLVWDTWCKYTWTSMVIYKHCSANALQPQKQLTMLATLHK